MKIITSPHLFLYPFDSSHVEFVTDWLPDKRSLLDFGGPGLKLPLTAEQLLARADATQPGSESRLYSISSREVGVLAGHGEILDIDNDAGSGRLARVLLAPMFRGAGYGHELVGLLCTAAFEIVQLREVTVNVLEDNAPAIACCDHAGFTRTDTVLPAQRIQKRSITTMELKLTADVWKSRRPAWAKALRKGDDCCSH